jgi:hypothetical protein
MADDFKALLELEIVKFNSMTFAQRSFCMAQRRILIKASRWLENQGIKVSKIK